MFTHLKLRNHSWCYVVIAGVVVHLPPQDVNANASAQTAMVSADKAMEEKLAAAMNEATVLYDVDVELLEPSECTAKVEAIYSLLFTVVTNGSRAFLEVGATTRLDWIAQVLVGKLGPYVARVVERFVQFISALFC